MARTATAVWEGSLREGSGNITAGTGAFTHLPYSFKSRFEEGTGSNPEELIAAAHSGCFAMAFGAELNKAGLIPERIEVKADVSLGRKDDKPTITRIALTAIGKVPGATEEQFQSAAAAAKAGCPISRLFEGNTEITLDAKLEQ